MSPKTENDPKTGICLSDPDGYRIEFESYTDVPEGTGFVEQEG